MAQAAAGQPARFTWGQTEYTLGSAPVGKDGLILVALPLPPEFSKTVKEIEASQQRYFQLSQERRLVRRTYVGLLLLLTMMVLFVTTWLALFLSKLVTRPLAALAEATQEISRNVQQAAQGTQQVSANITDVQRGAGETGSASSQVLAAAQSLSTDSNRLKLEVGKFLSSVRAA